MTEPECGEGAVWEDSMDDLAMAAEDMELRCVLAVVRHGDRTPKQKMKMVVNQARAAPVFPEALHAPLPIPDLACSVTAWPLACACHLYALFAFSPIRHVLHGCSCQ